MTECRITASLVKGDPGKPRGTFRCECGFTYSRVGPDETEDDRLRFDSVKDYGHIWEQKLESFWMDPSSTFVQMAEELGFGEATVIRRAVYLGLPYPRGGKAGPRDKHDLPRHYRNIQERPEEIVESRRQQWLDLRAANPDASRKQLLEIAPYLHYWLRMNDREWYEANCPPPRQFRRQGRIVDWDAIDPELSAKVIATATHIKTLPGKPVHASLAAVIRAIGHQLWLEQRLDKLPLTAQALTENLETLEAFQIRKVHWAANQFLGEGICPTRHQLMAKATARNATGRTPSVQSVIDREMGRLTGEMSSRVKRR